LIDQETLLELKKWFADYVETFQSDVPEDQLNIDLKDKHTRLVCEEIIDIGRSLALSDSDLRLAEVTALFHDVGRFEQYARYHSFLDIETENHALLGIRILHTNHVLDAVDEETRDLIFYAISNHNRACLTCNGSERQLFFTKMLRDADKLDIWRVVTEYYHDDNRKRNGVLELNLPDTPEISVGVYKDLMERKIVKAEHLKNLNDFKLLQIGWVFDVNFPKTLQLVRERKYIEKIYKVLPKSDKVAKVYKIVMAYLEKNNAGHNN
jgi:hypothetical protein